MSQETTADTTLNPDEIALPKFIEPSFLNALPHYIPLAVFPLFWLALLYGGWWMVAPFIYMSLAGPMDKVFGPDNRNLPINTPQRRIRWHNIALWGWAVFWFPTVIFALYQILVANPHTWWEEVILIVLVTMEGQAVFMIGHELIHRRTGFARRVGELLLACGSYPTYATEHVYIHHAQVGTPRIRVLHQKALAFGPTSG